MQTKPLIRITKIYLTIAVVGLLLAIFILSIYKPNSTSDFRKIETIDISNLSRSGIPFINIKIENHQFTTLLDLGFSGQISLNEEATNKLLKKEFLGSKKICGVSGIPWKQKTFKIPKVSIQNLAIKNILLLEECEESIREGEFSKDGIFHPPSEDGKIGWFLFEKLKILIDCPKNKIHVLDTFENLNSLGYQTKQFVQVPMLLDRNSVEFEALLEGKPVRILLDTGSTFNIINQPSSENKTLDAAFWDENNIKTVSDLKIEGHQLEPLEFRCIALNPLVKINVVLGMKFFKKHQIFLDFENEIIQIH